jgi:hypothetical protein
MAGCHHQLLLLCLTVGACGYAAAVGNLRASRRPNMQNVPFHNARRLPCCVKEAVAPESDDKRKKFELVVRATASNARLNALNERWRGLPGSLHAASAAAADRGPSPSVLSSTAATHAA